MLAEPSDRSASRGVRGGRLQYDVAGCWTLILALWLATRPYRGIVHDAQLYAVHALAVLNPAAYAGDLHLRFGTQDRLTLLSPVYTLAVSLLGVAPAHFLLAAAGQLLWIGGLVFLVRSLIGNPREAILAVALAIALPAGYGGLLALSYGEPFLTPRLYGEALTMIAIGHGIRRHTVWATLGIAAALAVHPLVALPGLAMMGLYAAWSDRRWAWLTAAIMLPAAILALSIQSFAPLMASYDAEWLRIIEHRDALAFLTRWSFHDFAQLGVTVALAAVCLVLAAPAMRRFLAFALTVGLGGLFAALIVGDGARNILVVCLQPWRAQWLLALAANIGAGALCFRFLAAVPDGLPPARVTAAIGLAVLVAARVSQALFLVAGTVLLSSLLMLGWEAGGRRRLPRRVAAPIVVVCVAIAVGSAALLLHFLQQGTGFWEKLFELLFVSSAIAIIAALLAAPVDQPVVRPVHILSLALLMLAVSLWDRRTDYQRFLESDEPVPPGLAAMLPEKASVYWEDGVLLLWLKLRRASFFSCLQSANAGFFRDNAILYDHRRESFAPLRTAEYENFADSMCPEKAATDPPPPTRETLAEVCRREPDLDYMVLMSPIDRAFFAEWRLPVPIAVQRLGSAGARHYSVDDVDHFYLYRCTDLRR